MVVPRGRRQDKTGGVPLQYVEDFGELRTTLAAIGISNFRQAITALTQEGGRSKISPARAQGAWPTERTLGGT